MNLDEENNIPKILILGSTGHGQNVTEYLWNEIPPGLNIADYQKLVMDFTPLNVSEIARQVNIHNLPPHRQFAKLLFSQDSEILVVGSPDFMFGSSPFQQSDYWLPIHPQFEYDQGETIRIVDQSFEYYLRYVEKWNYCVRSDIPVTYGHLTDFVHEAGLGRKDASMDFRSLAENRYKRPIAFSMSLSVGKDDSSEVIWLPAPNTISSKDAIDLLLSERYGISIENQAPQWLSKYPLPMEIPILNRILEIKASIVELEIEESEQKKKLIEVTKFHKLLYETGEGVLEPVVRDALKELGAEVEESKAKGREDGRLKDPFGRDATLEIKGREGPLRLRDINELDRWVRDSLVIEERHSKGILIGNLLRDQELVNRGNIFPDNCLKAAKNSEICLLTTSQIYKAIQDKQNGKFDQEKFWNSIFAASGVCNLPNPEEDINPDI